MNAVGVLVRRWAVERVQRIPAGCDVSPLELSYLHKVEAGQQSDALFAQAGFKSLFGRHHEVLSVPWGGGGGVLMKGTDRTPP